MAATEQRRWRSALAALCMLGAGAADAAVLPENRLDVAYHYYDGDGVTIEGPAVLVRRSIGEHVSVSGGYYVDSVSGASIDAITTASPYSEQREEYNVGVDLLHESTLVGLSYTNSEETDYTADTFGITLSQEIFAGMTTVSMGYLHGIDEVRRSDVPDFAEDIDRRSFRLGVTQVLTRSLIAELAWETISDEGFLNNPYRQVRFEDPDAGGGFGWEPEVYPDTRTSNAVALRSRLHLPWRGALQADYRYFSDDWDIVGHTAEIGYTHGAFERVTLDVGYRYHTQSGADFYSDLFPFRAAQNFRARNKEISDFASQALRVGAAFEFWSKPRSVLNLSWERVMFDYSEFRDVRTGGAPGEEDPFSFEADVVQSMITVWF
ncbi:MAG: DUF3570 domain-containing protein [Pseudomonadales bacterium]|nr:DUF3570 domain-containing protein [Pseudomonadales bacterium]